MNRTGFDFVSFEIDGSCLLSGNKPGVLDFRIFEVDVGAGYRGHVLKRFIFKDDRGSGHDLSRSAVEPVGHSSGVVADGNAAVPVEVVFDSRGAGSGFVSDPSAGEMVVTESVVVGAAMEANVVFKVITFDQEFAARADDKVSGAVVAKVIVPNHNVLHEFITVFEVDSVRGRDAAVFCEQVVFDQPSPPAAVAETKSLISDQSVLVKVDIDGSRVVRYSPDKAPPASAAVHGFGDDFGLIKFKVQKFRSGRHLYFTELQTPLMGE